MQNAEIQISEIFYSIQGEGLLAGRPSVFVRLAGCPLRCRWCDTQYALNSSAGKKMSIDQIITQVKKYSPPYVVITGGEPLISPQISLLCQKIKEKMFTPHPRKPRVYVRGAGFILLSKLPALNLFPAFPAT